MKKHNYWLFAMLPTIAEVPSFYNRPVIQLVPASLLASLQTFHLPEFFCKSVIIPKSIYYKKTTQEQSC